MNRPVLAFRIPSASAGYPWRLRTSDWALLRQAVDLLQGRLGPHGLRERLPDRLAPLDEGLAVGGGDLDPVLRTQKVPGDLVLLHLQLDLVGRGFGSRRPDHPLVGLGQLREVLCAHEER